MEIDKHGKYIAVSSDGGLSSKFIRHSNKKNYKLPPKSQSTIDILNSNYYMLLIKRTALPLTKDITKFACSGTIFDILPEIEYRYYRFNVY